MSEVLGPRPQRLGDYELVYELKSGGMGKIFLGRKRKAGGFEKLVAIKTILRDYSDREDLRTMFLDEARLLARLEHPAVAQVHDFGEENRTLYLAMEYVAGVRFSDLKTRMTPPGVIMRLVAEVCRALHAAHELRDLEGQRLDVVHRDVSPDNLMLSFEGHVKVLDFGIALMRGRHSPATEYGTIKGKPPYLSPEQVKGGRVDCRSDVWSVGVVLWELLTGRNLFEGDSLFAIAMAVSEQPLVPPSREVGALPDGLDAIVMRSLCRDVEDRYQDAGAMADALESLAARTGAMSIADFSEDEFREEVLEHRTWLFSVLEGGSLPGQRSGRPTGMRTAIAEVSQPEGRSSTDAQATVLEKRGVFERGSVEGATAKRRRHVAALGVVSALIAGVLWFLSPNFWTTVDDAGTANTALVALESFAATAIEDAAPVDGPRSPADAAALSARVDMDARAQRADLGLLARHGRTHGSRGRNESRPHVETKTKAEKVEPGFVARGITQTPAIEGLGRGQRRGTLTIAAKPYALVRINGVEVGATPQLRKSYPAGRYVIELVHPDTGLVRLRKVVNLAEGAHQSVIVRP